MTHNVELQVVFDPVRFLSSPACCAHAIINVTDRHFPLGAYVCELKLNSGGGGGEGCDPGGVNYTCQKRWINRRRLNGERKIPPLVFQSLQLPLSHPPHNDQFVQFPKSQEGNSNASCCFRQ